MPTVPTESERRIQRSDWYLTFGLAVSSVVFAVLYFTAGNWPFEAPLWVACLTSVLISVPLLFRRRWPSRVAWAQSVVYGIAMIFGAMEPGISQIIVFMGIYSIGAWQIDRRTAFISRVFLCIAMFALFVVVMVTEFTDTDTMTVLQYAASIGVAFLVNIAFFGGAWVFGDRAWNQRRLVDDLKRANEEVHAQERQLAQQALDLERVRIARELHDGVAHHIAGVGIHAAAARRSLERNPEKARESLKVIEDSTRQTVDELRSLVYTLRETGTDDAGAGASGGSDARAGSSDASAPVSPGATAPGTPSATESGVRGASSPGATAGTGDGGDEHRVPCLGDLPELIAATRATGRSVELMTIGEPRCLSPITETAIYRIVQESLTNSQRYAAPDAEVEVRLRYGDHAVEVEISDSASAGCTQQSKGTGMGIIGMRERITALDGTLRVGPKSRGGWLVSASIPYPRTGSTAAELGSPPSASADSQTRGHVSPDSESASREHVPPPASPHDASPSNSQGRLP
ncbi:signal transduction histidine kinase [Brevibacterium sanguinis]|uniref:histidine kinase n=2 Tax=Brevibacterium TaxID=1696 RepID=A0A366ILT7_9MICO|nr:MULTISPECIES: sensor histidine kinase [Brevibacterium]RBP67163.1 signal transduction histidine kinase [Brevibacterium sanguinis]RBP73688.1 signal transduction histidine kinase [Brevibacterium celere]